MMSREIELGRIKTPYYSTSQLCTVEITLKQTQKGLTLSICGNIWNNKHTDITEGGQIQDTLKKALSYHTIGYTGKQHSRFTSLKRKYADIKRLLIIWDRWHLNDMNAGCEHQRELLRDKVQFPNQEYTELIKHSEFIKCSKCGYAYGSKWIFEELPPNVVEFIKEFAGENLNMEGF